MVQGVQMIITYIKYSFLLKWKISGRKQIFEDCTRFSTSFKNMENEKPYTRRIKIFKTIVISQKCGKNCFPIIYNNCPKTY